MHKETIKLAYILLVLFICEYIYTSTGKREDLWESHVKRPKVSKCLGAYMSISQVLYLSRVLTK